MHDTGAVQDRLSCTCMYSHLRESSTAQIITQIVYAGDNAYRQCSNLQQLLSAGEERAGVYFILMSFFVSSTQRSTFTCCLLLKSVLCRVSVKSLHRESQGLLRRSHSLKVPCGQFQHMLRWPIMLSFPAS